MHRKMKGTALARLSLRGGITPEAIRLADFGRAQRKDSEAVFTQAVNAATPAQADELLRQAVAHAEQATIADARALIALR